MATRLDTAQSSASSNLTYSVSAANNRRLVVFVGSEGTQSGQHTCDYGGQTGTFEAESIAGSGTTQQTVTCFTFTDAQIAAASGTTISAGNVPTDYNISARSYQDCEQGALTNTDTDSTAAATPNPLAALDITTVGSNAIVAAFVGVGNATTATWASPLTEQTDQVTSSAMGSMADDEVPTATTIACEPTIASQNRAAGVAIGIEHEPAEGIDDVDSDYGIASNEFDYNDTSLDINGSGFEATQGTGDVYISDANTLAGSANEVDVTAAVTSWSDTQITLNLTNLSGATYDTLSETLGPGTRYIIVVNNSSDEYGSPACAAHRAKAIDLSLSANIAAGGANTTGQLTAPTSGTFGGGRIQDDENPGDAIDLGDNQYREDEWSIEANLDSVYDDTYQFRVLIDGQPVDTYTVTPQLTITAVVVLKQTHQMII